MRTGVRAIHIENKLASSSAFPPALVNKFAEDTADDFKKWYINIINARLIV